GLMIDVHLPPPPVPSVAVKLIVPRGPIVPLRTNLPNVARPIHGLMPTARTSGHGIELVHEFDTMTGCTRGWHETVDRAGNVRQIRPERNDGATRHYQFDSNGRYGGGW